MLVLSRKLGQRFHVGPDVQITIVKIDSHAVRIGIQAPNGLAIYREEIVPITSDAEAEAEVAPLQKAVAA